VSCDLRHGRDARGSEDRDDLLMAALISLLPARS
jgi:hypothetical protein